MIKAGSSICDITPDFPAFMCGYPTSLTSTGVHDKLYNTAMYIECGGKEFLYLMNDLCYFSRTRSDSIIRETSLLTGIPESQIILCTIHTHSGPCTANNPYTGTMEPDIYPEYMDKVSTKIAQNAKAAKDGAFPAKLGWGKGTCGKEQGVGGNRHNPDYDQDPAVLVFGIRDMNDVLRCAIVNYALHPTVLHADNSLISADYVAYTRLAVNEAFPEAKFGFVQGCSGNQSTRYFRHGQTFEEAERIGGAIGKEVVKVLESMTFSADDVEIKFADLGFKPSQLREIPALADAEKNAEKAKKEYQALIDGGAPYSVCRSAECTVIGADQMVQFAAEADKFGHDTFVNHGLPVRMKAVSVGDWAVFAVSAEMFVNIGLDIKKNSPFAMTFVSTLSQGNTLGYICSDYAYDEYCYEPQSSLFCRGIAGEVVEAAGKLLESVK